MTRPLDDCLVVSLEQAIAAPYCTRLMADNGARVIKVERPDGGDFARAYDTRARGLSSHFVWTNRSKESLVLDLKDPAAIEALKTILSKADVFVQNLAPGAVERLGLDPADLREANPGLITCSISGYGRGGPAERRKAYDLLIQAEAGFLSVTGTRDHIAKAGISIADIAAGITAYQSILAALLNRHKTGKGDHIEVSMLEAMAEWMGFPMYFSMDGQEPPSRNGAGHATIYPYGPFETADGQVLFGLQNDREWIAFAEGVLGRPDLAADSRFEGNAGRADHRPVLDPVIRAVFASLSTNEALQRLETAGIGTARVNDMHDLWDHEQLAARDRWREFDTPAGLVRGLRPVTGNDWEPRFDPVPSLGEHTRAILSEFGCAPTDLKKGEK
ncbi:CaiB/BaiF CoA transferase family protein [Oricola nitratireducens]|uniref:CaiB/BaiF CoA transferase family protein n=1 Tax=Oricola nitratireducens TaxID=2775868 RepID=UPI0018685587|nr:CaiB/BaiF CoA-transferase family protein [Oricola nitratireducens]